MRLILLGTEGCHLCDEAEAVVSKLVNEYPGSIVIEAVDIAEQEQWQEKYAVRIPVLYHPETKQELGWPFDHSRVTEFIRELKND